jgi:predicted esterase
MVDCYDWPVLSNTLIVGVTPYNFEWYPMPNGIGDQRRAVLGLKEAVETIDCILSEINRHFSVPAERTALVGFSAGAVMAIQAAAHLPHKFPVVVAHAGAILEPEMLPVCRNKTPIYLFHNQDDSTFDWVERFLPMKNALITQGYNIRTVEGPAGRHMISEDDLVLATKTVAHHLGQHGPEGTICDETIDFSSLKGRFFC